MMQQPTDLFRRSSIHGIWEKAKKKQAKLERSKWAMIAFEYGVYTLLLLFIYFVLVGVPLWKGLTWYMWYVQIPAQPLQAYEGWLLILYNVVAD